MTRIAVITTIMEKTPTKTPSKVSAERSLWAATAWIPPPLLTIREQWQVGLMVWFALVPVPVTVTVYVPAAALPALSVSVEFPPAVTDAGLNEAVAPAGKPLALSDTV